MYHNFKNILYHGTISEISHVDVTLGRQRKDFGRGFYMAISKQQAIGMMHKKYKEALRRNNKKNELNFLERLYEVRINKEIVDTLNIKIFEKADLEWLEFVLMCREKGGIPHNYDLVAGPTADDNTALCIRAYSDGMYGKTGTTEAMEILLRNLETENLGIQYFIGKQDIADKLIKELKLIDWR
ncbi:MAG: DUF3990 domain-containing protein [Lachnospiraceae bacterium]